MQDIIIKIQHTRCRNRSRIEMKKYTIQDTRYKLQDASQKLQETTSKIRIENKSNMHQEKFKFNNIPYIFDTEGGHRSCGINDAKLCSLFLHSDTKQATRYGYSESDKSQLLLSLMQGWSCASIHRRLLYLHFWQKIFTQLAAARGRDTDERVRE